MKPHGRKRSPLKTVVDSNLAIWPSNWIRAGNQVLHLMPATANPRQPMQKTLYDREGRRHGGHAMLANGPTSLVVSHVFHINGLADSIPYAC